MKGQKTLKRTLAILLSLAMVLSLGNYGILRPVTANAEDLRLKMTDWVDWQVNYYDGEEWEWEREPRVAEGNETDAVESYESERTMICWNDRRVAFALFDGDKRSAVSDNSTMVLYEYKDGDYSAVESDPQDPLATRLVVPADEIPFAEYKSETDTFGTMYLAHGGDYLINDSADLDSGHSMSIYGILPVAGFFTSNEAFSQQNYLQNHDQRMITEGQPIYFLYDKTYVKGIDSDKAPFALYNEEENRDDYFAQSPHGIQMEALPANQCPDGYGGYKIYVDQNTDPRMFYESVRFEMEYKTDLNDDQRFVEDAQDGEFKINLERRPAQMFAFNWARCDWKENHWDVFYENDDFWDETGMDAWANNFICLSLVGADGDKKPYDKKIKVTKASWTDEGYQDTGEVLSEDSYNLSVLNADDERYEGIWDGRKDVTYYDIRFDEEGLYCLTAEEADKGNKQIFINATRPIAAFYRDNEISRENYVQDWSETCTLSKDESIYLMIDNTVDENRKCSLDGLAKWNEEKDEDDIFRFKDEGMKDAYPYLKHEIVQNDENGIISVRFFGNGENREDIYDDLKCNVIEEYSDGRTENRMDGINVRYPVMGMAIKRAGEDRACKTLEQWVSSGKEDFFLQIDGEPFTGQLSIDYEGFGNKDEVNVFDGNLRYEFDRIGSYLIKDKNNDENAVVLEAVNRPIDFFSEKDFAKRFSGRQLIRQGEEKTIYLYLNKNCTEEVDGHDVLPEFDGMRIEAGLWPLTDEYDGDEIHCEFEPDEGDILMGDEDDDGLWMSYTIPESYNFEGTECRFNWLNIQAKVKYEGTDRWHDVYLNAQAVNDGRKMIRVESSHLDNISAGKIADYVDLNIYPFGAYFVFTPVEMHYNTETGEYDAEEIVDFDPDKLIIGYWKKQGGFETGNGVEYTCKEDGTVEATFHMEGRFEIGYGDADGEWEFLSGVYPHQPEMDFYVNETKPGEYEEVKLLTDKVTVREMKGVENDTFYVFWKGWNQGLQDEFGKKTGFAGNMNAELAAKILQRNDFDYGEKDVAGYIENYLTCLDPDSFRVWLDTASGKIMEGDDVDKYLTITDVLDGSFVVGKKIIISEDAPEDFVVNVGMYYNGYAVYRTLFESDDEDHVRWDNESNFYLKKEGIGNFNDCARGVLNNHSWTGEPKQYRNLGYEIEYAPFVSLKLDQKPAKVSYTEGDKLDLTGLAVSGVYQDKTEYALAAADYSVNLTGALKASDDKVVITYKNNPQLKCEYAISVSAKATPAPTPTPTPGPSGSGDQKQDTKQEEKPAAVGMTIAAASGAGANSQFKVDQAGDKSTNGKVTYAGEKTAPSGKLNIPDQIIGTDGVKYDVVKIDPKALKGAKNVTELNVGDNITEIPKGACSNMTGLTKVTLGKNVQNIAANAFSGDTKMKTLKLTGTNVQKIGKKAFYKTKVQTFDFSKQKKLTMVGANAFAGTPAKTIKLYVNKLKTIGSGSVKNLTGKKKVKFILYAKTKAVANKAGTKLKKGKGSTKVTVSFKKAK
ncbi:MAG: leucine-rich repeat domain-containing protein [Lachnospiraceae bacterium]|nr:leucine-rich repeat domain-containing protein [Lachnospiraceae bacterium]